MKTHPTILYNLTHGHTRVHPLLVLCPILHHPCPCANPPQQLLSSLPLPPSSTLQYSGNHVQQRLQHTPTPFSHYHLLISATPLTPAMYYLPPLIHTHFQAQPYPLSPVFYPRPQTSSLSPTRHSSLTPPLNNDTRTDSRDIPNKHILTATNKIATRFVNDVSRSVTQDYIKIEGCVADIENTNRLNECQTFTNLACIS